MRFKAKMKAGTLAGDLVSVHVGGRTLTVREATGAMGGTGGRVWSCSVMLMEWLVETGVARGRHVVELGCGTGVVGIACSEVPALGALSVVLSDMDDDSLDLARANLTEMASKRTSDADADAKSWSALAVAAPPVVVCKFNWADPVGCLVEQLQPEPEGDPSLSSAEPRGVLVVGSDVCYNTPAAIEDLCKAVKGILRHPRWRGAEAEFVSVCGLRERTLLPCLLAAVCRHGLYVVDGEPEAMTPSVEAGTIAARHVWDGNAIGSAAAGGYVRFALRAAG